MYLGFAAMSRVRDSRFEFGSYVARSAALDVATNTCLSTHLKQRGMPVETSGRASNPKSSGSGKATFVLLSVLASEWLRNC